MPRGARSADASHRRGGRRSGSARETVPSATGAPGLSMYHRRSTRRRSHGLERLGPSTLRRDFASAARTAARDGCFPGGPTLNALQSAAWSSNVIPVIRGRTVVGDRLPIAAIIALIYFGVVRSHRVLGLTMLVVLATLVVWTAPNRWGAGIALHYLSRVYWPDPADPIPPPPATGSRW
jgi:hypothetical protein